jgi:hypothetical protein
MIQEPATSWDYREVPIQYSSAEKLFLLYLLVLFLVALFKLIRIRKLFRGSIPLKATDSVVLSEMQNTAASIKHWIHLTLLVFSLVISFGFHQLDYSLIVQNNPTFPMLLIFIRGLFPEMELTFLVLIFVFLVRWYIVRLIAKAK